MIKAMYIICYVLGIIWLILYMADIIILQDNNLDKLAMCISFLAFGNTVELYQDDMRL